MASYGAGAHEQTAQRNGVPSWLSRWALTILMSILLSAGAWVVGATRSDTTQQAEIDALRERQAEQEKKIEQKVSRDEFVQFTKAVDDRLTLIQRNTDLILTMQRHDRR